MFPFHAMTIDSFPGGDDAVGDFDKYMQGSGVYVFPSLDENPEYAQDIFATGPVVSILVYRDEGIADNMNITYFGGFVFNILTALFLTIILSKVAPVLKRFWITGIFCSAHRFCASALGLLCELELVGLPA